MKYDVAFISNTQDDLHCFQAAYMMILKFFKPQDATTWEQFCDVTGFETDKGTWATLGLLWFYNQGFQVRHISLFDYKDFAINGGEYLIRLTGPEVGQWQVDHSNISYEQRNAKALLVTGIAEQNEPTQDDIKQFLEQGYLVRCLVNAYRLNGKEGYFGHSIVVIGYDETGFIIHDPGLPPKQNRHVDYLAFEAAWADPSADNKELDAIRLK